MPRRYRKHSKHFSFTDVIVILFGVVLALAGVGAIYDYYYAAATITYLYAGIGLIVVGALLALIDTWQA